MFYNANADIVFNVVFNLSTEVYYGWWLRNIHANGASFFFLAVYLHMARGIYYGSFIYPRHMVWVSGSIIWVLMIATAFLGYILPWGQMSFWGAMVITSLLGALPGVGADILFLLWGSYSIDNTTLHRFYSLHYTLPFIIFILTMIHFGLLHEFGSNNGLGINNSVDYIPFVPYYGLKDGLSIIFILIIFFLFVIIAPDKLGHSDNFILANPLVTPVHIVPEWYFLPLYGILRSVTNKLLGIFLIACAIIFIMTLPFFYKTSLIRSAMFKPFYNFFVWVFFVICLLLGWVGSLPVLREYFLVGLIGTICYFIWFAALPILSSFEFGIYLTYKPDSSKKVSFWKKIKSFFKSVGHGLWKAWLYSLHYVFFPPFNESEEIYWTHKWVCLKLLFSGSSRNLPRLSLSFSRYIIVWVWVIIRSILFFMFGVYVIVIAINIFFICSISYCLIVEGLWSLIKAYTCYWMDWPQEW